jgi:hypothetical protein
MDPGTLHATDSMTATVQEDRGLLFRATVAGAVAALAGGIAWAVIVVVTNYAVGYMATGVGLLAGFAVHFSARQKQKLLSERDWVRLQIAAVASAIGGLVVGNYLIFDLQHGGFSPDVSQYKMLGYFVQMLPETLTAFDAVWGALAVYAAWKITRLSQLGRHL